MRGPYQMIDLSRSYGINKYQPRINQILVGDTVAIQIPDLRPALNVAELGAAAILLSVSPAFTV